MASEDKVRWKQEQERIALHLEALINPQYIIQERTTVPGPRPLSIHRIGRSDMVHAQGYEHER